MPNCLPPFTNTFCVLLARGEGEPRLHELTASESKPALPFAGGRLVDFAMENAARSGLRQVLVATQYQSAGLAAHLHRRWSARFPGGLQLRDGAVTPPGYCGTADALRANLAEIARSGADTVLVLSADHVYRMDYRPMIARHLASGSKVTVAADTAPLDRASSFGVLSAGPQDAITGFAEKPARPAPVAGDPGRALVSMGIYVFDRRWLETVLADPALNDFGHDILPLAVAQGAAQLHRPEGEGFYWRDVGTLDGYRLAHLDFLRGAAAMPFPPPHDWRCPPQARLAAARGTVLLPGASLGEGVRLARSIVAPGVHVPDGLVAGRDPAEDAGWFRTTTAGTVLITAPMAERWREAHARRRAPVVWRPCPGLQEA
jgi:ADP-glucose pyrophosphorylase